MAPHAPKARGRHASRRHRRRRTPRAVPLGITRPALYRCSILATGRWTSTLSPNAGRCPVCRPFALLAQLVEHFHGKRVQRRAGEALKASHLLGLQRFCVSWRPRAERRLQSGFAVLGHRVQYQRSMEVGTTAVRARRWARPPSTPTTSVSNSVRTSTMHPRRRLRARRSHALSAALLDLWVSACELDATSLKPSPARRPCQ